ncbi:DUF6503 family protein [Altibacter sp. HG106]|uniref:DUF6503 family protein n=1 Tax=Altibacter sp. HG106 TaxID=3023937 RepID=UPI0023504C03|nr:DUF6503 family protein [Altibacter sp. HG106]MDC7995983.1 hypothetical protein [Altibacter sp. HG106]
MRNTIFYLFIFYCILSCEEQHSDPFQEGDAILASLMEVYGAPQISKSHIEFTVEDLYYTLERNNHLTEFTLRRTVDSIDYVATYKNGYQEYFVNGEKQTDGSYSRFQLTQYLDAFTFIQGIPHVFNGNAIIAKRENNVTILDTEYHTLHISYKPFEGSPGDTFYLYIEPETNFIRYMAEKYQLNGEDLRFLKFVDHRTVNKVLFADYFIMSPLDQTLDVSSLYEAYNNRNIKEERKIVLSDISVTLN